MKEKIIGLDIFRTFSAIGIMVYHWLFIGVLQGFYAPVLLTPICFLGEFGVDSFFILSGFLIIPSTRINTITTFIMNRIKRIYPPFFLTSLFTLLIGTLMPDTQWNDLITRWFFSVTFSSDLLGMNYLSNVYWTLFIEVRFYFVWCIMLYISRKFNINIINLVTLWTIFSFIYVFSGFEKGFVNIICLPFYAGHFALGIILYLLINNKKFNNKILVITPISICLIYNNMIGYTNWIKSMYPLLRFDNIGILLIELTIILFFIACSKKKNLINNNLKMTISFFSAISYTFYLIHADLGYFVRTQYYYRLVKLFPIIQKFITEYIIFLTQLFASIIVAYWLNYISNRISKRI